MASILVEILGNARQFKAELASAEAATAKASGSFAGFTKVAGAAGVLLAGGVAFGMAKAIGAAGDFEQKLNVLRAVTSGTNREMEQASKLAIKLGADAKLPAVSAGDAADAMLQLGKAGFTMRQSMAAARGTLLLATAAQIDSGLSAKTVTQSINAFGLKAKDTSVIVDEMAGFMNTTGTTFEAFADSLSYVSAPAHAVGQSFKETAAQLAILSKNGQEGSMAGTGLRKMLNELVAGKARGFFHDLGVETVNANNKFIGMHSLIQKLHPILEKMTAPERLALMKQAFGLTAMNQANILLGVGVDKYDAATAAIGRKGQADQLAASHMQGYKGAMAQLGSALETLEIEIGLKLLPIATRFALWLTAELPIAVANAKRVIAFLTPYFIQVKDAVEQVVAAVRAHWSEIVAIIKAVVNDIKAQLNLFGDLIHGRWDKIWDDVVQVVKAKVALLVAEAKLLGPALWTVLVAIGKLAVRGLVAGLEALPGALEAGMKALPGLAWTAAQLVGEAIVKGIKWAVPHIAGLAGDLIGKIGDAIGQVASWAFSSARQIGFAIADGVISGIGNLGTRLKDAVTGAAKSALGGAKSALGISSPSKVFSDELGKPMADGVVQGWLMGSAALPAAMSKSLQAAITHGRTVIQGAQAAFQSAWSRVASSADTAFDKMHSSILTKSEKLISAMRASAEKAQRDASLAAAKLQLTSAQAPQTDAEKALAGLQSEHDDAGRSQALSAAQTQLANAQAGGDADAILSAQQQLADAQYSIQVAGLQKQIDAESSAATQKSAIADAQRAVDDANKAISDAAEQARLDKQAAAERVQLDARNEAQKTHFDTALTRLQTHLANGHASYADAHKAILKLFKKFGVNYSDAGADLGISFVTGLRDSIADAAKTSGSLAGKLEDVAAGIHIPHAATGGFVSQTGLAVIHQGETITPAGAGGGVTVIVNGWVGDDQAIAEKIRNTLIRTGRTTTGGALGGFA